MPLTDEDKQLVQSIIDDAMAGAGEALAKQARTAAKEAIDEGVKSAVAAAVSEQLGEALKPVNSKLDEAVKAAGGVTEDRVLEILAARDAEAAEAATKADGDKRAAAARDAYVAEKMTDVPAGYRAQMPATADAAELAKAEKAIREQAIADARAAGWKVPDLGDAGKGGKAAGSEPDKLAKGAAGLAQVYKAEQGKA